MLPNDQWYPGGKDGERCATGSANERGWLEESPGRSGQAVSVEAGRVGEVEGQPYLNPSLGATY